jgi:high-affinity nickel permease
MTDHAASAAFLVTMFTVFVLGLRHGADPDHLAAIDNLTRNAAGARNPLSRFVGALFAGGHSVMVLSIAALAGLLGSHIAIHGALLETVGTWASIVTLFAIALFNVRQLASGRVGPISGLKSALLPAALRAATSPFAAIPVGLLFGLGFDTSSQVATYALAFTSGGGVIAALVIGVTFSAGMAVTDTLDSMLVYKLCTRAPLELVRATRVWIVAVTSLALVVGSYELAQVLGWQSPVPDIVVSGTLVASLLAVFAWTFTTVHSEADRSGHVHTPAGSLESATGIPGGNAMTKAARLAGGAAVITALAAAMFVYSAHPVRGSDHQDSLTVVNRPGADITDVFVYQAPDNPANVVLQMDVFPLIPHASLGADSLDPAVLYQFKIDNVGDGVEHMVLQLQPTAAGTSQSVNVYGPAAPGATGTSSVLINQTGSVTFNDRSGTPLSNGVKVFVGDAKDPFFFDLAQFFKIIPDRNYANQPNPPPPTASGFRGFAPGNPNGCDTTPAVDILSSNGFNVIAIVAEMPKSMLGTGKIGVWATTSTTTGN